MPVEVKTKLRPYQVRASKLAYIKKKFALFFEMGCGKTVTALSTVVKAYNKSQASRVLVLCPRTAIDTWQIQIHRHIRGDFVVSELTPEIFSGDRSSNMLRLVIVTYDKARNRRELIKKFNPDAIICDESHKIKGRTSRRSKFVRLLSSKYKMILTGTPVDRNETDLWAQFRFLSDDILGESWDDFEKKYCGRSGFRVFNPYKHRWEGTKVYVKRVRTLRRAIKPYSFRISKKTALGLPPVIDQDITVELGKRAQKIHDDLRDHYIYEDKNRKIVETNPGVVVNRLQQITGGFIHHEKIDNSKIKAVIDIIENYEPGRKIVIFCRFIDEILELERVMKRLSRHPISFYGKTKNRRVAWMTFQNNKYPDTFIAQIDTGGESIELYAANVVIFYSTSYRWISYDQALSRVDRHGQTQKVTLIRLKCKNTIDMSVWRSIYNKGSTATQVLQYLESDMAKGKTKTKNEAAEAPKRGRKAKAEAAPEAGERKSNFPEKPKYGVAELADEMGVDARTVRIKLREAEIDKEGNFYDFGSAKGVKEVARRLAGKKAA